jgi:tetratricopeptide (TPR) repeat protein
LDDLDGSALLGLVQVRLAESAHEAALAMLEAWAPREGPNLPFARKLRGAALARLGREEEARVELAHARNAQCVLRDPWTAEVVSLQRGWVIELMNAITLLDKGMASEAARKLESLQARAPGDPRVPPALAGAYAKLGRIEDARRILEAAVAETPLDALLHVRLAEVELLDDRAEAALAVVGNALNADPRCPEAHEMHARLLYRLERYEDALAAYETGLRHGAGSVELWIDMGRAYVRVEKPRQGARCFELALRDDSSQVDAWIGIALTHFLLGDHSRAREALGRAESLDASHPMLPVLRTELGSSEDEGGGG